MHYGTHTALIVVDVQNDFADSEGSLHVPGGEQVIPFINEQVREARATGATVVFTQDWHPPSTPHFAKDGGPWPVHCVAGTTGAEFHPTLDPTEGAILVRKGTRGEDGYSAFSLRDPTTGEVEGTGLLERLRERGVDSVVVVGLALDYCVKETALDAVRSGFTTILLADGTKAVDVRVGDGARAVAELILAGVVVR